jgi:hypothetical protein
MCGHDAVSPPGDRQARRFSSPHAKRRRAFERQFASSDATIAENARWVLETGHDRKGTATVAVPVRAPPLGGVVSSLRHKKIFVLWKAVRVNAR